MSDFMVFIVLLVGIFSLTMLIELMGIKFLLGLAVCSLVVMIGLALGDVPPER